MSRRFISDQRDQNHRPIVEHLRKHGIEVVELFRPVDLLVYNGTKSGWLEVKMPGSSKHIKRSQIELAATTKMPFAFATSEDQALQFAKTMDGLTQKQKDVLAGFLLTSSDKLITANQLNALLAGDPLRRVSKKK